jgi:tetratricopeptide (TPR) repeat protein
MPVIGKTLAHYEIIESIGAGGMGEVYRARDTKLDRDVAIKVLPGEMAQDADRRMRFEREARAIAALNHTNIVTIHAVDEADGIPFLVMELVQGKSLADHICSRGMPLSRLFDIAVPLADALAAAHKQGITHRDLKPTNVMVTRNGIVKVLDFGLAKLMKVEPEMEGAAVTVRESRTDEGRILGTVAYMSPEQAEGKPVDVRTDIFSLGVLLYEMATGRRPFAGETSLSTITAILRDDPPSVTEVNPSLPRHLGRIIRLCLAKDPDQRYQSALDVRNELRSLHQEITSGDLGQDVAAAARARSVRRKSLVMGLTAAALVLAVFFGRTLFRPGDEGTRSSSVAPDEPTVAVIGFENLSDPEDTDHIGRMLRGLITTHFAESRRLPVVSMSRVLAALRETHSAGGRFDPTYAAETARAAGANLMVVGQVGRAGERLILTAEIGDVVTGHTLGSHHEEANSAAELFAAAEAVASHLGRAVPGAAEAQTQSSVDLARMLTDSPDAYRHYVAGELALHRSEWDDAFEHLRRAIEADSTFALAYYRAAMATWWNDNWEEGLEYLEEGRPHVTRLPGRWRSTYTAALNVFADQYESAYNTLSALASADTDIADVYYLLGEIVSHFSKYQDIAEARRHFERALEIDPTFYLVAYHLVDDYIWSRDLEAGGHLLTRLTAESLDDDSIVLAATCQLRLAQGRCIDALQAAERTLELHSGIYARPLTVFSRCGNAKRALELAEQRGLDLRRMPGVLANAYVLEGHFREAAAAWEGAREMLSGMGSSWVRNEVAMGHSRRSMVLALSGDLDAAEAAAQEAVAIDPLAMSGLYTLGWVQLLAGDVRAAETTLEQMVAAVSRIETPHADYWTHLLRAELQLARDGAVDAAAALEPVSALAPEHRDFQFEYFLRGRVFDALGDLDASVAAYREAVSPISLGAWGDMLLWTLTTYYLAIAEENAGETDAARANYEEFLRRWGDADVTLPQVEDARERLARLPG